MTESPEIVDDDPPPPKVNKPRKKSKSDEDKGVGVGLVIVASAIATVLGVTGGAILGNTLAEPAVVQSDVSQADLDAMRSALDGLKSRTKKLETEQGKIQDRQKSFEANTSTSAVSETGETDMADFTAELIPLFEDIEGRLNALESGAPKPETMLDQDEKKSEIGLETPPALDNAEELSALSNTISDIETRLSDQSKKYVSRADLQALKKRVEILEDEYEKAPVLIPPFPREAVMDALTGKKEDNGSWMSGLLGDEVRVVDAETVRRLDRIEKSVEAGDINAIKTEVGYLPAQARPVIDSWLAQFEQSE